MALLDSAYKQRMVGALVLVALAVIFLPMLVKGPAPDSGVQDVPLSAPAAPARPNRPTASSAAKATATNERFLTSSSV